MHRSGSGVFNGSTFELKAWRSTSEHHNLVRDKVSKQITSMMREAEGDHTLLQRLATRRIVSFLQNRVTKIYYKVMLRLTRREKQDLNSSATIARDLVRSRLSSKTHLDFQSSLNRTFSLFSATQPGKNVRQLIGLINKKFVIAKLSPFLRLKKNLQTVRTSKQGRLRGLQILSEFIPKHSKRLKRQMFFTLMSCTYSHVRESKCALVKQINTTVKKSGQHLIKTLKKVYRGKLKEVVTLIKEFSCKVKTLQKLSRVASRVIQRFVIASKRQVIKCLKRNKRQATIFTRIVCFSNVLFRKMERKALKVGWLGLTGMIAREKTLQQKTKKINELFSKLTKKRLNNGFNRIHLHVKANGIFVEAVEVAKKQLQESEMLKRKQQISKYEEVIEENEHLLKKEQVENQQLIAKLISLEKSLAENNREQRIQKNEILRLQRELKQKDALVKRFLMEQNKTNEFLAKQKDQIFQLRMGRQHNCDCIQAKNKQFVELTEVGRQLNSLIEKYVEDQLPQSELSQSLQFVRQQYQLFAGVLEQSEKMINAFCLNPLFKNDFPVLSYIRNSLRQVHDYLSGTYANFLTEETLETYIERVRSMPQQKQFDALELNRLTNQIIDQLRPDPETSGYQLVKSKVIEFSRCSETFNREYRRLIDKNTNFKNLISRLDTSEKDMRNYLYEFHDSAMVVGRVTVTGRQSEQPATQNIILIRPLLLDLLSDRSTYQKKTHIREKLMTILDLTQEERVDNDLRN